MEKQREVKVLIFIYQNSDLEARARNQMDLLILMLMYLFHQLMLILMSRLQKVNSQVVILMPRPKVGSSLATKDPRRRKRIKRRRMAHQAIQTVIPMMMKRKRTRREDSDLDLVVKQMLISKHQRLREI